jgi:indolepyruvate ferredoxin oxidoreductase beta subunit
MGGGEADILLAFEKGEAARWGSFLRDGACAIVNDLAIPSLSVSLGRETYFEDDGVMLIKGSERAAEMGDSTVLNVFMLGALSMLVPFNSDLWKEVISRRLPHETLDINLMAFQQGRREMLKLLSVMPDEDSCANETHDDDCGCH